MCVSKRAFCSTVNKYNLIKSRGICELPLQWNRKRHSNQTMCRIPFFLSISLLAPLRIYSKYLLNFKTETNETKQLSSSLKILFNWNAFCSAGEKKQAVLFIFPFWTPYRWRQWLRARPMHSNTKLQQSNQREKKSKSVETNECVCDFVFEIIDQNQVSSRTLIT